MKMSKKLKQNISVYEKNKKNIFFKVQNIDLSLSLSFSITLIDKAETLRFKQCVMKKITPERQNSGGTVSLMLCQ